MHPDFISVLEALGSPHLSLPPVIHVAGTNGKGSVVSYLSQILAKSDMRVHQFTSPHLVCETERILLAGQPVSREKLAILKEKVRQTAQTLKIQPLRYFQTMTIVAFLVFSETPADYVILETGLGGRLDPTNVVPSPYLTLITSISLDHQDRLGSTLKAIAYEKAGIIKPQVPVLSAEQKDEVLEILKSVAQEQKAPFASSPPPQENLFGRHQSYTHENATLVWKSLLFFPEISQKEWPISRIEKLPLKGRLDHIKSFFPKNVDFWVDGAHNIAGFQALADYNKSLPPADKTFLIWGLKKGRPLTDLMPPLKKLQPDYIYVCDDFDEATDASLQVNAFESEGLSAEAFSLSKALSSIKAQTKESPQQSFRVFLCGSLYLVGLFYTHQKR